MTISLPQQALGKLLVLFLGGILTACTGNVQYRTDYLPCTSTSPEAACPDSAFQVVLDSQNPEQTDYLFGFVEFDDQGQLFDRQQLDHLEDLLIEEGHQHNLIMVVFVHGWKHNARPGDENIRQFRKILTKLAEAENRLAPTPRKVVGIYLGWRGQSFHLGPFTNLTFWDRKSTAHKVGHGGAVEVLARLEGLRHIEHMTDPGDQGRPTRYVIVGHSFGGALVHSALSQLLMERFIDIEAKAESPREFSDLVVLINPAFEAMRHATLFAMADERSYFPSQRPILTVLTSEADLATKVAFPLGRTFSTFWDKERNSFQEAANKTAVGHFKPFQTHYLAWEPWPEERTEGEVDVQAEAVSKNLADISRGWQQDLPISVPGSELRHEGQTHALNPYLNIYVNKRIIQGHNEIYADRLVEFLRHFILLAMEDPDPVPAKP